MAIQLFVNIQAASVASGLVKSVTDLSPVTFPQLVVGDNRDYELYLVDGLGSYASFSGSASYNLYVAIGDCGFPSGATFTLTFGANTTAACAWNIAPSALQTVLQGLASIGSGNCAVTGVAGQYYIVTFTGSLGDATQAEITANTTQLTPASTVDVSTIIAGGASSNCVQLLNFATNPITYADDWVTISNGWKGTLSTRTLEIIERFAAAGGSLSEIFQVTVGDPDGNRRTYVKAPVQIQCTIINPEAFAGANKPNLVTQSQLAAAVLGYNNFTYEALTAATTGNTNVSPSTTSRHHTAVVSVTGAAGNRPVSIITTNSPVAGDTILLQFLPAATAGLVIKIYNATTGGTLLETITTDASATPYFLLIGWIGAAWGIRFSSAGYLSSDANLAELASPLTARFNLHSLFSEIVDQSANFIVNDTAVNDDGVVFRVTTSTGAIVATLPTASSVGAGYLVAFLKADSASGSVATSPATEVVSQQNELMLLMSDGTNWVVLFRVTRPTTAGNVINSFAIAGLTGGTDQLDGLVTADGRYPIGTVLLLSFGTAAQWWQLYTGTDASNAPAGVVRPTDFDASTNAKVWKKIA